MKIFQKSQLGFKMTIFNHFTNLKAVGNLKILKLYQ